MSVRINLVDIYGRNNDHGDASAQLSCYDVFPVDVSLPQVTAGLYRNILYYIFYVRLIHDTPRHIHFPTNSIVVITVTMFCYSQSSNYA